MEIQTILSDGFWHTCARVPIFLVRLITLLDAMKQVPRSIFLLAI